MAEIKSVDQPENSLGSAIKRRRKLLRLTQRQLADLAGCHPDFVSDAERDKPTLRLDKLQAILTALGLRLAVQDRE